MDRIFVTADTHFNHTNICGSNISKWSRGYRHFDSLQQMNDTIIDNINAVVQPDDKLFHLGDFAFGDKKQIPALRERINCKNVWLLYGNHDDHIQRMPDYQKLFVGCHKYYELRHGGMLFCMFHYPIGAWNENGRGSVNLHGHSHGNYKAVGRQLDIGVDCHDFKPLLLDDIVSAMQTLQPVAVDHHNEQTSYH